jgi:hypothetical protein
VKNFKTVRKVKRESVTVPAVVTSYREKNLSNRAFNYKLYIVTVRCRHRDFDAEQEFVLSTTSHRGKRYARDKNIEVIFLTKADNSPVLTEELRLLKRDRFIALFGGLICNGFLLLLLVAFLLPHITGKYLPDYFPGLF